MKGVSTRIFRTEVPAEAVKKGCCAPVPEGTGALASPTGN